MSELTQFLDLHNALASLKETGTRKRVDEFAGSGVAVFVVGLGGFPITTISASPAWCGYHPVTSYLLRREILNGLGSSALLTYMNNGKLTLKELGNLCVQHKHFWGYRWVTLSLLFMNYGLNAEISLARDSNFYMSWPTLRQPTGQLFMASGSLAAWIWFTDHAEDLSFNYETRLVMKDAGRVLHELLLQP